MIKQINFHKIPNRPKFLLRAWDCNGPRGSHSWDPRGILSHRRFSETSEPSQPFIKSFKYTPACALCLHIDQRASKLDSKYRLRSETLTLILDLWYGVVRGGPAWRCEVRREDLQDQVRPVPHRRQGCWPQARFRSLHLIFVFFVVVVSGILVL